MNHKSIATCPHCGESTRWGTCTTERKPGKLCGSKGFPQQNGQVYCVACKTVYDSKECEHCGKPVRADEYRASSFLAGLFGG